MNFNLNKDRRNAIISLAIVVVALIIAGFFLFYKKSDFLSRIFDKSNPASPINFIQLRFNDKSFKLDHTAYSSDVLFPISSFEGDGEWQGDGNLDDFLFWEKKSSLLLESRDNAKKEAHFFGKFDLSKYPLFRLAVNLQSEPSDLESVRLVFSNRNKTSVSSYPITNLVPGWNFLRIPKIKLSSVNASSGGEIDWKNIERVSLEVSSRFNSIATVNFDDFVAFSSEDYLDDWLTTNRSFLDLAKTKEGNIVLQAKNVGATTALLKKISGVSDFTFKAKVQPLKNNTRSGLFIRGDYRTGYGYYFLIDGIGGSRWQILKVGLTNKIPKNTILVDGMIKNFIVEANKPLWLRAETKGTKLRFFLSPDGKVYTLLGEANDDEFKEGGVGIAVYESGVTQFDDMEFNQ